MADQDIRRWNELWATALRRELTVDELNEFSELWVTLEKKQLPIAVESMEHLGDEELVRHLSQKYVELSVRKTPEEDYFQDAPLVHLSRVRPLMRYFSYAAVLLAIAIGVYLWRSTLPNHSDLYSESQAQRFRNDIPAAQDGAVLTLADGRQVILDDTSGTIAKENGVIIVKRGRELVYEVQPVTDGFPGFYNTVTTSKGRYVSLTLADGSRVWLNAASHIRYPVRFSAKERRVEVSGEAYFEVASDKKRPFVVIYRVGNRENSVEVLGTHFNIRAYEEESRGSVTLVEGAVRVKTGIAACQLQPGQQALENEDGKLSVVTDANIEKAVGWKEGLFVFDKTSIQEIMRELARWYDVEVEYAQPLEKSYHFMIGRDQSLSKILNIMETTGDVKFIIEGKKITVFN